VVPPAVLDAYNPRRFVEVTLLDEAEVPVAFNVIVGNKPSAASPALWHGTPLADLSGLVPSSSSPDWDIVPVLVSTTQDIIALNSVAAASLRVERHLKVQMHQITYSFAVTDFKLQGRTMTKIVLNICHRISLPYMNMPALYVLLSRAQYWKTVRLLYVDEAGLAQLETLQHDEYLVAWERGYDENGIWSDALASAALESVRNERSSHAAKVKARDEAAKKQQKDAKAAATKMAASHRQSKPNVNQARKAASASASKPSNAGAGPVSPSLPANSSVAAATALPIQQGTKRRRLCSHCSAETHDRRTCDKFKRDQLLHASSDMPSLQSDGVSPPPPSNLTSHAPPDVSCVRPWILSCQS
jgi:hypothetical protein